MDKQTMVKVDNVGIRFNLAKERVDSLKEYFLKFSKGTLKFEEFWALDGVSLEIEKGDFYGLVGINGSGKSTLLKAVAGVFKPTRGKITVNGTIAPLIELGAGFDMDLTARENIFLNGAVLGFSKDHMMEKFDDIVDFSELHDFLDVPLKNYSSGMVARIAFAIATATKPDILIADEILAVGDYAFQEKCEKRMQELLDAGTTVIFVSHSIEQVKRMCNKATWIEKGKVIMTGDAETVCDAYSAKY
ncbi:MAG: ABC transporter ATP-binding protein [Oscillospiraceae bacterium]|nr:ABC transporter ATP-binding protein [Oscillospiraceae bacterium]